MSAAVATPPKEAPAQPAAASPRAAAPTEQQQSGQPAAESKWVPLPRDYVTELEVSLLKRTPVTLHPLLPKEVLRASTAASGASSASAAYAAQASASTAAAATPAFADPLSAASPRKSVAPSAADPLGAMLGAAKAAKAEVFDPLRAMASAEREQKKASDGAVAAAAVSISSPKSISKIESVSVGEVQLDHSAPTSPNGTTTGAVRGSVGPTGDSYEPWRDKRASILTKFTTNKRIPVQANFLEEEKVAPPKAVDSAKSRLEELEQQAVEAAAAAGTAEGVPGSVAHLSQGKINMTQKEYIAHIEEQHERLKQAWESGERVLSLKIAIQCAKLLGDSSVPHFYPSMYVLLTDILDTFGDLVFERIKRKGVDVVNAQTKQRTAASLPVDFAHTDVSASAQETCRNWLYKTACVRELIPRLYIDLCLLKCYRFVDSADSYPARFARLSRMIRGIGDPLSAAYARAYLATKCGDVHNSFTNDTARAGAALRIPKLYQPCLVEGFDDFLFTFKALLSKENIGQVRVVREEKVTRDEYIDLYSPALEWLLQNIGFHASEDLFFALLQQYKDYCNCSAVLVHILSSFSPAFVSQHALDMTAIIKASEEIEQVPRSALYLALGKALIQHPPPQAQRLPILNDVWKVVTKIEAPLAYAEIAAVFVQYLLINFTEREVNIFLKDVIKHLKPDGAYKQCQDTLALIVAKIMQYSRSLAKTLAMEYLLPTLDLLEGQHKVEASKAVLMRFSTAGFQTCDPVILHTLFDVARAVHDAIDSLSFDDERRQVSMLLINFIRQIDFGRDLEQQLNIYVECRSAFTSLDLVTQELVLRVALLCMRAHRFMKGAHSKKTAAFVKACLAYAHITIPSLEDIFARLRLLLQCGSVALVNGMIVQAEGFLKAAISLVPEVPPSIEVYKLVLQTEEELVSFLRNFAAFLLLFPGHPEHGPFYLVKGLLNAVQSYEPWNGEHGSVGKSRVFLGVLSLFCTYAQRSFPYHIARVESNDDLYGGEPAYSRALAPFLDTLVSELLQQLSKIGERGDLLAKKQQGTLALDLANVLVSSFSMNAASATLVVRLVQLAQKSNAVDVAYLNATIRNIQAKRGGLFPDIAAKLLPTA